MCHFILELHLISNYLSSSSSLRKGHFKKASGTILTLHPIKDSQEVWNKYKVQIWDILSEPFFLLPPESQSGKSDKNISLLRRLTGLLGPRNTVNTVFQQASEHSRPQCPLWEVWTQNGWKQVSQEWDQNSSMESASQGQSPHLLPHHSSLQFNQLSDI